MTSIAWIGLGVMGYPMAGHLATKSGFDVRVYNRTAAKADDWVSQYGFKSAPAPIEAATDADFVFSCVGNDDDLREVTLGVNGAFHSLKPGAVYVDHKTASADIARELYAAAHERGAEFLDAPVSGGDKGAQAGSLTVMVGGDEEAFERVSPLIGHFSRSCRLMGPAGAGQLTKMVNQIAAAGIVQSLAEAVHFAESADLDIAAVMDVITKGASQSWIMENRWQTMAQREFDFGFAIDWMRKDLAICLGEARHNGSQLPLTALVDQFFAEVQAHGGGRFDTSGLITRLSSKRGE